MSEQEVKPKSGRGVGNGAAKSRGLMMYYARQRVAKRLEQEQQANVKKGE